MKVGCGYVEKEIHGGRYLYFWCFQSRGGGVRKVEKYMGPANREGARQRTLEEIEAYTSRAMEDLRDRLSVWRRELAKA